MKCTGSIDAIEATVPMINGCLQTSSKSLGFITETSVDVAVVVVAFVTAKRRYFLITKETHHTN
jgi:hypothetical protein